MSEWTKLAIGLFGVGLGALLLLACVFFLALRLLWNVFGHDAVAMLGDAWRNRLSTALRVAPPPLPPLDVPKEYHGNVADAFWTPEQRQQRRDEGVS